MHQYELNFEVNAGQYIFSRYLFRYISRGIDVTDCLYHFSIHDSH